MVIVVIVGVGVCVGELTGRLSPVVGWCVKLSTLSTADRVAIVSVCVC